MTPDEIEAMVNQVLNDAFENWDAEDVIEAFDYALTARKKQEEESKFLATLPSWARIGKRVRVIDPSPRGKTNIPTGTVGRIKRFERGLIWVQFLKPVTDVYGNTWLWEPDRDKWYWRVGYEVGEIEPYPQQESEIRS